MARGRKIRPVVLDDYREQTLMKRPTILRREFTADLDFMGAEKMLGTTARSLWTMMGLIRRSASLWPLTLLVAAAIPAPAHADVIYLIGQTAIDGNGGGELLGYNTPGSVSGSNTATFLGNTTTNNGSTNIQLTDVAENTAKQLVAVYEPTPTTSTLYLLTATGNSAGTLSPPSFQNSYNFSLNALVYDTNGTLWAAGGNQIYSMTAGANSLTALTNPIGVPGYTSSGDLAFVGSALYLTETNGSNTDILVRINTANGSGTEVGTITLKGGTGVNFVHGLATIDNTLYGFAVNSVYTIDPYSGDATQILDKGLGFGTGLDVGVHGAAADPSAAVPEPSSMVLAGVGALTCIGYAWSRRRGRVMSI
jgi:PEP-CTERM motif